MKNINYLTILLVSLFFSISINTVEAQVVTTNEIDSFTNTAQIRVDLSERGFRARSRDYIDSSNDILPSVTYLKTADGNEVFLFDLVVRNLSGCLSEYSSKIMIRFEDADVISLGQISDTECSSDVKTGRFVLGYDTPGFEEDDRFDENTSEDNGYYIPNLLAEKRIDAVRVYGSEGYRDYEIKEGKKEEIKRMVYLLLNEVSSD